MTRWYSPMRMNSQHHISLRACFGFELISGSCFFRSYQDGSMSWRRWARWRARSMRRRTTWWDSSFWRSPDCRPPSSGWQWFPPQFLLSSFFSFSASTSVAKDSWRCRNDCRCSSNSLRMIGNGANLNLVIDSFGQIKGSKYVAVAHGNINIWWVDVRSDS